MMERDHCLVAGLMLTPILLSELNTNCPTASSPGLDMFLSLTQDTYTSITIKHCALRHIELCQLVSILVTCELERCLFVVQLKCVSFLSKKYPAAVQSSLTVFLWALSMVQWRKALLPADTETFQLEVVRSMAGSAWPAATSSRM